jgi:tRNA-dihydrouridine synthase B
VPLGLRHARKHLQAYAAHALALSTDARAAAIRAALIRSERPVEVKILLREAFALAGDALDQCMAVAA